MRKHSPGIVFGWIAGAVVTVVAVALADSSSITATTGVTDSATLDVIVQAVEFR